jgi:HK97 family phage prohead protease
MPQNLPVKQFKAYEVKNLPFEIKDMDNVGRRVKIALAAFNNIDSDRDVIRKGAFAKSIQERGAESTSNRKIAHLRYHDWEHQIGKFIEMTETDTHLVGLSDLGRSTKGNDAFLDYQDGIIREHSIGFNYIPDKMALVGEGDQSYFEIKEVILWEGSAVTFGANSLTPTLDVTKGNRTEVLERLNKEMTTFVNALRNGKGTDDRLFAIEMGLKVCQQKYNSLITFEPPVNSTKGDEPNERVKAEDTVITEAQRFYTSLLT